MVTKLRKKSEGIELPKEFKNNIDYIIKEGESIKNYNAKNIKNRSTIVNEKNLKEKIKKINIENFKKPE